MTVRGTASLLMVLGVLLVVIAAVRAPSELPEAPRQFFSVEGPTAFLVPGGVDRLRVVMTRRGDGEPPVEPLTVEVAVTVLDSAGATLARWWLAEETRAGVVPGIAQRWAPRTRVMGEQGWLTEPRVQEVALPPGAATVVVDGDRVLIRPFVRAVDSSRLQRVVVALSRDDRQRLVRATGAPDPGLLTVAERDRVLGREWVRLAPRDPGTTEVRPVSSAPGLGAAADVLLGTEVPPGAEAAWTVIGDARLYLGGSAGLEALALRAVGEGEPELRVRPAAAGPWAVLEQALTVDLVAPGLVSLVAHNPTEQPVRVWARAAPDARSFGAPPEAALSVLDPRHRSRAVQPEMRLWDLWTAEARRFPAPSGAIRLEARQRLRSWEGEADRTVHIRALDARGALLWEEPWTLSGVVAPLEGAGSRSDRSPVSEATTTLVRGGPAARWIEVDGGPEVLVRAHVPGPERGRPVPTADPAVRVRFAQDAPTSWVRWSPERSDLGRVHGVGQVRVEPVGDDPGAAARRYRSLALPDGAEPWLLDDRAGSRAPTACRVLPGAPETLTDPAADDLLRAWLWAPDGTLGEPWSLAVDGRPWRGDRLRQRVSTVRGVGLGTERTLTLSAPSGTALWVQGSAAQSCSERRRVVSHTRLAPGGSVRLALPPGPAGRLLAVAGLGDGTALLELEVVGGSSRSADATRRTRVVSLEPTGRRGRALRDPGPELEVLDGAAIRLGADLSGGGAVVLRSRHPEPLWIRGVVEGSGGDEAEPARILRLEEVVP